MKITSHLRMIGLLLAINSPAFSQNNNNTIKTDSTGKNSETTEVKVFIDEDYFDDSKGAGKGEKNLIKISPLMILNGEIPIFYERKLSNRMSAELGLGVTLRDYLGNMVTFLDDDDFTGTPKLGTTFRSELRFYPNGEKDFPEAAYFAFSYRYKNTKVAYNSQNTYYEDMDIELVAKSTFNDFVLVYGAQYEWESSIYFDYYLGTGLRNRTSERLEAEYDEFGERTWKLAQTSKIVPLISLGLKVGFAF